MLAIVIPIYNDWSSFEILVRALNDVAHRLPHPITILGINDGSTQAPTSISLPTGSPIRALELITLNCNLGHQRAIAIGLSECLRRENLTAVLVMDSDGEDSPSDIVAMVSALGKHPEAIVVARRAKRSEKLVFRVCYAVYKSVFRCLTGEFIDFGNFCLLPIAAVRRIVFMPDAWNHFAATLVKSRVPLQRIPTERATRFSGRSSMNMVGLVMHGFSAISVFSDRVLTRLLLLTGATSFFAIAAGTAAVLLRLFTDLAIPGWATNVFGLSCLLFFQSLTLLAVMIFTSLSNRSSVPFIPGVHSSVFVAHTAAFPCH
jgi:polyisoprenyl-phosphate glycosyltransferase